MRPLRPEILLSPPIPPPLHSVNPRSLLGAEWWRHTRKEALRSTGYRCAACGYGGILEAHEVYDVDFTRGRSTYLETVPLCRSCHQYVHVYRLATLVAQGKAPRSKLLLIERHGSRVLTKAGLKVPMLPARSPSSDVAWKDWRLVIEGNEYPPKYKSREEWREAMGS